MAEGGLVMHLEVSGLYHAVGVPACGAWSRNRTPDPELVTCQDCKATLSYVMASSRDGDDD